MHTKDQIHTILETLEVLSGMVSSNEELFTEVYDAQLRVESIIDFGYTTSHLKGAYMNPIEEAVHCLWKANYAIRQK